MLPVLFCFIVINSKYVKIDVSVVFIRVAE